MSLLIPKQSTKLIKINSQLIFLNAIVRGKRHKVYTLQNSPNRKYLVRENTPFLGRYLKINSIV